MFSILAFLTLMGAFLACVWYAVTHEDLTAGQTQSRGPLARALGRVRKRRSSPEMTPASRGEESTSVQQSAEPSSAPGMERPPPSPAPRAE